MEPLFRLDHLGFGYDPERPVLKGVCLDLVAGEKIALSGPNGAGKTTLFHLMLGLLVPSCGRIVAFGNLRQREKDFKEVRRRAGLLFQDSDDQLFCPTVTDDIAFGPLNLGKSVAEARGLVDETLASLGLQDLKDRLTHTLSGGQKRLVALATVLAMRPEVLLLDEPTNGLDDTTAERLTEVLAALPQAMMIISHDRRFLDRVATRGLHLHEGRLSPSSQGPLSP